MRIRYTLFGAIHLHKLKKILVVFCHSLHSSPVFVRWKHSHQSYFIIIVWLLVFSWLTKDNIWTHSNKSRFTSFLWIGFSLLLARFVGHMAFQSQRLITCLRLKLLQQPGALNLTCRYWLCPFRHFCYTAVLIFKKHPFSTGKWLRRKPRSHRYQKRTARHQDAWKTTKKVL